MRQELFASPLNARFPTFCSAAPDVDAPFGSVGSFFGTAPRRGAYLANPPFVDALVTAMAERMRALLDLACAHGRRLTFLVILPHWPDKQCWQALSALPHCRRVVLIPQQEHGYLAGGQQYRPTLWQPANHDSSLHVLQSDAAMRAAPFTPELEQAFRVAFRTKPG